MKIHRYSRWDGTQEDFSLEELDIINHLMAMRISDFGDSAKSDDLAA